MKKYKAYLPLLFPVLIILIGLIIYKFLDYEPNFYTIIINIGLAYILSPRVKTIQKQNGTQEQLTWVFFKKIIE
jgi:branched-subunit amino acid ABC-type transport system permease component